MTRLLLDLFCCQGGAAKGYADAGFVVIGVDRDPQPRYPFQFVQGDALEFLAEHGHEFDAIHASPPCQDHSILRNRVAEHGTGHLLADTLSALRTLSTPWVVENVEGAAADMPGALRLCGTEFGLTVVCEDGRERELRRHRLFLSSVDLWGAGGCGHNLPTVGVYGDGGGGPTQNSYKASVTDAKALMGCDWMTRKGLSQAIPPAYTRFLGTQLLDAIEAKAAA